MKIFWRKYNGAQAVILWLPLLFISTTILKSQMDIPYPFWELVLNLIYALSKIFLAEFIASVMLQVMQPQYFEIIHNIENVDEKCKTPGYRDSARYFYFGYILLCGLVLAFA